ncbi:MAG: hypothetical protein ACK5ZW_00400 [Betaproteobacteria bacterium]|jgi:hypothetical protein
MNRRLQSLFCLALALNLLTAVPVSAADRDPLPGVERLLNPQLLFGGVVREADVSLLFDHLRATLAASAAGREPPAMPEALARRFDEAGGELRQRGTLLGLALSHVAERALREALRDFNAAPPRATE